MTRVTRFTGTLSMLLLKGLSVECVISVICHDLANVPWMIHRYSTTNSHNSRALGYVLSARLILHQREGADV
jgi:hypothetical protein